MNSNTHNQSLNNSTLSTSPISIYSHIFPRITNPFHNPTIVDFERLIPLTIRTLFFLSSDPTTNLPKTTILKTTSKKTSLNTTFLPFNSS